MLHNSSYNLDRELDMVWLTHDSMVATGCMLWLFWFGQSQRSLENMSPPNDLGRLVAMEVTSVWMHNAHMHDTSANFSADFDHYCGTDSRFAAETNAAIEAEERRVFEVL